MSNDPSQIGRYVVQGVLGRGGMGVIYRAHDPEIDRIVAIKLILADLLEGADRADFIARFRREAQAAGRCAHPNIVAVHDFALHEGNPFLAMEFVDGVTLAQVMAGVQARSERMPVTTAASIIQQVLLALEAAHALGVVHRDIKPANIMLTADNRVKVADFGISRLGSSSLTQDGAMVGTPSYMSPEQCRGEKVDARSDLYSVGAVLFELLAGRKPFPGKGPVEVISQLLNEPAPHLATLVPDVSAAMAGVVRRALAKQPAQRFGSAIEMATALRAALDQPTAGDGTVVLRRPQPETRGSFDRETIDTLERRLAEHVGPIARHLVQNAARTSDDMDSLCASLAANIEGEQARASFARDVRAKLGAGRTETGISRPGNTVTDAELATIQLELARYVGPVAKVLIRRAQSQTASAAAVWDAVAASIENAADRAAFLKRQPS